MTITRWSPLATTRDLAGIRDEFDRLFENTFQSRWSSRAEQPQSYVPPVDVEENSEEFVLRLDLPGVPQKDVKVSLMGDTLTIRGERKPQSQERQKTHRIERAYGRFERTFTLGTPVRNDLVAATYKDGVLEVHVPKAEEARVREIQVQVG